MRIGTLHVGFRDGLPRELANKARYGVGGRIVPGVGTIALNHALLDLGGTGAVAGVVALAMIGTDRRDPPPRAGGREGREGRGTGDGGLKRLRAGGRGRAVPRRRRSR